MDDGIEEDEIEERVRSFIDDLDIIVKALWRQNPWRILRIF